MRLKEEKQKAVEERKRAREAKRREKEEEQKKKKKKRRKKTNGEEARVDATENGENDENGEMRGDNQVPQSPPASFVRHNATENAKVPSKVPPPPTILPHRTISIDPGIRTFATGYDDSGYVYEWGGGEDRSRLMRLGHAADKMLSRADKKTCKHRERRLLKKRVARVREKIRNLTDDLHRKLIKWLVTNFTHIVLPPFNGHQMNARRARKINSQAVRQMMSWSHGRFRQRLLDKVGAGSEFPHSHVFVHEESYTSKTCGSCGEVHGKLGGSKTFHCPTCRVQLDRDYNGARNILLKFLTERSNGSTDRSRPVVPTWLFER